MTKSALSAIWLVIALAGCASPSGTLTPLATEMQRQTAALASETSIEYHKCATLAATATAYQPSDTASQSVGTADAASAQCAYVLDEYENNDRALVLATDPADGAAFADQHAKRSRINLASQLARPNADQAVLEQRTTQARQ